MLKEVSYHHGSKPGSLLGLRQVILLPGSFAAIQDTRKANLRLETRQAHLRLETCQAQGWKRIRLLSNDGGGVIPPWQQI
jgi:hypothetical protein